MVATSFAYPLFAALALVNGVHATEFDVQKRLVDVRAISRASQLAVNRRSDLQTTTAVYATDAQLNACPGYNATNVKTTAYSLTADLKLAGAACNVYGPDLTALKLRVTYETASRIHVKIADAAGTRYQVPESVVPRPNSTNTPASQADIHFNYTVSPFTFSISRSSTKEVLFATDSSNALIFEPQYLRLKNSAMPANANVYGLGEHTDSFRLPNNNLTRTMWSRDAYGVPPRTNLYGNHPIYFEHRTTGTHGVFLLNSNGMDIKINQEASSATSLEYNLIGGIFDFYFLAGPTPTDVARQYAEVVGKPAEVGYWSFGLHQCRYGYHDYLNVAAVVKNYSSAGIPLETMWTDIDYMHKRWTFTNDAQYFPTDKMRELVSDLHNRQQKYILMIDPAVAYQPNQSYGAYDRGDAANIFLPVPPSRPNNASSKYFVGIVWPGPAVFPDWFNPKTQEYWTGEVGRIFNKDTGIDVDGMWIDMNEPSSFCSYPCTDPIGSAIAMGDPPARSTPPPPQNATFTLRRRDVMVGNVTTGNSTALNYLEPPYAIHIATTALSDKTSYSDIVHADGHIEYDTHNMFGSMMSYDTRHALEARRPGQRTLVITRSTFAGAGSKVGKWLGDNLSDDEHYRNSIAGMLGFASIYQVPMVGADVCGFGSNTTEILCARWAMLGGFSPFFRNHNDIAAISQEFYRWPLTTQAAKNVIDMRYRLIDYIYTAMHKAHTDGSPILNPLFFKYPSDPNTFPIDLQFFFGDSILVSPVTTPNATDVTIYVPKDTFYDFLTYAPIIGNGTNVHLTNVSYTSIPVYIRGGAVLPLRASSANTTTELRKQSFELVVAPGTRGTASGSLYIDDGISIVQTEPVTYGNFSFASGKLSATGTFASANNVSLVSFLGQNKKPSSVLVDGKAVSSNAIRYDAARKVARVTTSIPLTRAFTVELQ